VWCGGGCGEKIGEKEFLFAKKHNNCVLVSLDEKKCVILHDYYPA
jgi:hypothetical protein